MTSVPPEAHAAPERAGAEQEETLLRARLAEGPATVEDWLELAQHLCRRQALAEAVAPLERALALEPQNGVALNLLGAVLQNLGQLERAEVLLERAVSADPSLPAAWCNLGIVRLLQAEESPQGREAARQALERALMLDAEHAPALQALTLLLRRQGDLPGALAPLRRLVTLEPQRWPELLRLGDALQTGGQPVEAEAAYRSALSATAVVPDPAETASGDGPPLLAILHANLGAALLAQRKLRPARRALLEALQQWAAFPEAEANLALVLRFLGEHAESLAASDRALALKPHFAAALSSRGLALRELGRPDEALEALRALVRLEPERPDHRGDVALCLHDLGRLREALDLYDQALALQGDAPTIRTNRAMCLLQLSDLREGWDDYEARLLHPEPSVMAQPAGPRWQGEDLGGAPLLVVGEQGFGDMIQFLRYVPLLRRHCGAVALCLPPNLTSLAEASALADVLWSPDVANAYPGPWLPLLSVCRAMAMPPQRLEAATPYLTVPEERIDRWRQRIDQGDGPLIALHWQGNPEIETGGGLGRSLPLEQLAPVAHCAPVRLLSLQKGSGADQRLSCSFAGRFIARQDLVDTAWDFVDTAAILRCCDLVISNDSAMAHLAGALGLPVWLLLKQVPDWRWGLEGDSTSWYPSMRLFRQSRRGDWDGVIARICGELPEALQRLSNPQG